MPSLIDDVAPPESFPAGSPEPPRPPEALTPEPGNPPEGVEPPAPPRPRWRRFLGHPAFRGVLWFLAVLVALIAIGLVFPPNFWRF